MRHCNTRKIILNHCLKNDFHDAESIVRNFGSPMLRRGTLRAALQQTQSWISLQPNENK